MVGVAWKTTSQTIASVTAPGCTLFPHPRAHANGSSEALALWVGLNCPAIPAVTMTLSGSSAFETTVNRYSGVTSIGELTRAAGTTTTPFTSITTQDSSNLIVMESASPGSDVLPTAGTGNLPTAGRPGSIASYVVVENCDKAVSAPESVTCSDTITSAAWGTLAIELRTANPADLLLVDPVGTSTNASIDSGNGFIVCLPQAALSGNAIIRGMSYLHPSSHALTISNESNTWRTVLFPVRRRPVDVACDPTGRAGGQLNATG